MSYEETQHLMQEIEYYEMAKEEGTLSDAEELQLKRIRERLDFLQNRKIKDEAAVQEQRERWQIEHQKSNTSNIIKTKLVDTATLLTTQNGEEIENNIIKNGNQIKKNLYPAPRKHSKKITHIKLKIALISLGLIGVATLYLNIDDPTIKDTATIKMLNVSINGGVAWYTVDAQGVGTVTPESYGPDGTNVIYIPATNETYILVDPEREYEFRTNGNYCQPIVIEPGTTVNIGRDKQR